MVKALRKSVDVTLALDLATVWRVLSDTDHFNRYVKLPKVLYGPPPEGESPFVRSASAILAGLSLRWAEYPFEWVENRYFNVTRVYDAGPVTSVKAGIEFEAAADGQTQVTFVTEVTPRSSMWAPVAWFLARRTLRGFVSYCTEYLRNVERGEAFRVPAPRASEFLAETLQEALVNMVSARARRTSLLNKFVRHLRDGGDDEVVRMRPYELAEKWQEDRYETLEFFLHATKAGVLTLDWQLMCPNCRVPKAEFTTFRTMAPSYHCDLCGIGYETDLEKYTELKFSVSPRIRVAEDSVYCIGSPARTPHVLAQQYLAPHAEAKVTLSLAEDAYRVRALRSNLDVSVDVTRPDPALAVVPEGGSAQTLAFALHDDGWSAGLGTRFAPGGVELTLKNDTDAPNLVVFERVRWDSQAVTAAEVTTMQEFRDLFSGEVLAPGQQVGVRNLCIMFTDLRGSTELYEQIGDAAAFSRVNQHFDYITQHVGANRGAVVKTIGDAVMAVFPSHIAAVRAAVEMQLGLPAFNSEQKLDPPLTLKVGIHSGPAIAVNANEAFDYFGRTVNIAARVQGESLGNDLVLSDEFLHERDVAAYLAEKGLTPREYQARLKGIEESVRLVRLVFAASELRAAS